LPLPDDGPYACTVDANRAPEPVSAPSIMARCRPPISGSAASAYSGSHAQSASYRPSARSPANRRSSSWSAAVGHHFARPGNRFWKTLHLAGFTDRLLAPDEEPELLRRGLGITNLVDRATATAADLTPEELRAGAKRLAAKIERARPAAVAVLGVGAYRTAFTSPTAAVGPQPTPIAGTPAWVLPNPSDLNAHYQLPDLAEAFANLSRSLD